jgi:hypothetical protein
MAAAAAAALSAVCLASSPAGAHGIVIENQDQWASPGSPYCNPCQMKTDFQLNAGSGLTNQVYVYATGLVSIGSPFPSGAPSLDPNKLTTSGTNFLALYYDKDPAFTPMLVQNYFTSSEDDVFFFVPGVGGYSVPVALQLTPGPGTNPGAFTVTWAFSSDSGADGFPAQPNDYHLSDGVTPSGYPLNGYQFGNDTHYGYGDENSHSFNYPYSGPAPGGVPEPSTWVELIAGLFGLGALLRRRAAPAPAAA